MDLDEYRVLRLGCITEGQRNQVDNMWHDTLAREANPPVTVEGWRKRTIDSEAREMKTKIPGLIFHAPLTNDLRGWVQVEPTGKPPSSYIPTTAEPGSVRIHNTKTGRFEEDFMKGWREFDLGKFAVSSIKVREDV